MNWKNSILQLKTFYLLLILPSIIIIFSIDAKNINSIFGQTDGDKDQLQKSKNNNKNDNINEKKENLTITIKVNINKNNIDAKTYDRLKIVGYLNGEGQTKYLDLKEDLEKKVNPTNENSLISLDLKFNKNNDISSTMVDDEYYVCGYVFNDVNNIKEEKEDLTASAISLYDCDEGNIGTSTTKDSVTLFSTMKKYGESKAFYIANQNKTANLSNPIKEVKVTINVPVNDAKDIDDMNVVAMIKGDYKIKTIDVQNELKSGKNKDDKISVPFTFNRQTEVGYIQPGDLFFGCATSDEFPNQNSDCEKRMLKDLDKISKLCARKDNKC